MNDSRPPFGHVSNGATILINPRSRKVKSFEVLSVENVLGTRCVVRINALVLIALYTPPTAEGLQLL